MAFATPLDSIGFRAYSSADSKTCSVFGMGDKIKNPSNNFSGDALQGFSPDPDKSRSFLLGTKGYGNYSGIYNGVPLSAMKFTCVITGTSTPASVKMYLNHTEAYFLTLDSDIIVIGR
jgi:hypothetical protein